MYILSELVDNLGKDAEARLWEEEAEELKERFIKELWKKEKFTAIKVDSKEYIEDGKSLILMMPIVLGSRLPENIKSKLLEELKKEGQYLSPYGLATEAMDSKYYKENGYWLGPIWAPVMMLVVDPAFTWTSSAFLILANEYLK